MSKHIVPTSENKAFVFDPKTGESKVYDFSQPDTDMLRQMSDVLLNRLGNPVVLKMLYLDAQSVVPSELKAIVQNLVDKQITQDEARKKILDWKATL